MIYIRWNMQKKMMRIMVDVKLANIMEIAIIVLIVMKALNINLI